MVGVLSGYWIFAAFIDTAAAGDLGWLHVYWVLLAIALANLALLAFSPIDERGAIDPASAGPIDDMKGMIALLTGGAVLAFIGCAFFYVLIEQSVGTWLPTFNAEVLHLPSAMSVQAASLFAAALALGRLLAGPAIRAAGWLPVLLLCVVGIIGVVVVIVPMAAGTPTSAGVSWFDAPLATYTMPMIGLLLAPIYPTINSAILSSLPQARHAAMTGLIITFSALGGTTGSFITGHLFAALGGATAFRLILVPAIALGILLLAMKRLLTARPA